MSTNSTYAPTVSSEQVPAPVAHATQVAEDGSSVQVGYTESDPLGPQHDDDSRLLAGKYKNAEELERAYKELEARLGSTSQPTEKQSEQPEDTGPKVAAIETTEEAAALLQDKGLDIATFTREYESTGQLSPESYTALEAKGISRDMVNAYIHGQQVLMDTQVAEVKNSVGGEAEYERLVTWATANLSPQEQQAYDRILQTNDLTTIKLAAAGLKSRYESAMGKDPQVVIGGSVSGRNDGLDRFGSRAEMVSAMQDPRYAEDPAYRAKVERKVINSNL